MCTFPPPPKIIGNHSNNVEFRKMRILFSEKCVQLVYDSKLKYTQDNPVLILGLDKCVCCVH